jgi:hypothetical protein
MWHAKNIAGTQTLKKQSIFQSKNIKDPEISQKVAAISKTEPTKFFKTPHLVGTNKSKAKSMSTENSWFGFRGNLILVVYLCNFFKQTLGSRPSRFLFFGYEPGLGPSPILAGFEQPSLQEGWGQWNKDPQIPKG